MPRQRGIIHYVVMRGFSFCNSPCYNKNMTYRTILIVLFVILLIFVALSVLIKFSPKISDFLISFEPTNKKSPFSWLNPPGTFVPQPPSGGVTGNVGQQGIGPSGFPVSGQATSQAPTINPWEIPQGFTVSQLSPYFNKIRIGSAYSGYFNYYGQISIYASLGEGESVDVSGWLMKGNRSSQYIPKAISVYDPAGMASEGDIVMANNETLYIYTNTSAINRNFRLNKCIGYLENYYNFTPSLPMNCPSVSRSEISSFTGLCQDYILSLGSCRLPSPNVLLPYFDEACKTFLNNLNYSGCFQKYRSDKDFLGREWRVWSGTKFLDDRHDQLLLFDNKGLLVDDYSY